VDVSGQVRGEAALTRREVALAPLVRGVVDFLGPLLDRAGMRVEVCLADDAASAYCDVSRIEQVLTNLLNNAMKYARRGKSIRIASQRVSLAEGHAVEIFDPYVRLSREDVPGGLGLGLAISRRIVEAHSGAIAVAERDSGGSRFAFQLPAAPADSDTRRER
jgi:signal transduction histidine kinase